MKVLTERLFFSTKGQCDIVDLTAEVAKVLTKAGTQNGTLTVFVPGATGAITTVEYEGGLVQDLKAFFERLIPSGQTYAHNAAWQDNNGQSHLRASLIGPSLSVPFSNGKMMLGTWQQIVFLDFDVRDREREVIVQIVGE